MNQNGRQSSEILLARINREVEKISEVQHRLARRKTLLQEQATRLRLGASEIEVRFALKAADIDDNSGTRWQTQWDRDPRAAVRLEHDAQLAVLRRGVTRSSGSTSFSG